MATFDRLPAEQRAIIELVLQRGQTYEELSGLLGMPPARVRDLAREALGELAPRTAERVEPDWRGQITDYLLRQQTGPEATATRGHLKRSEPARVWAMSLLDSLSDLYPEGSMPEVPEADSGAGRGGDDPAPDAGSGKRDLGGRLTAAVEGAPSRSRERPAARAAAPGSALSPAARKAVLRRRIIAGAIAAVALVLILLWIFGVFNGSDNKKPSSSTSGNQAQQKLVEVANLKGQSGSKGAGVAAVFQRGKTNTLVVQAAKLTPSGRKNAYEVWLYNSQSDAIAVGAQLTDTKGNLQAAGNLPAGYTRFKQIVMSRERIGTNPKAPTNTVLRGPLQAVPKNAQQGGLSPGASSGSGTGTSTTP